MDGTRAEELVERYADAILRIGYTWLGDMDDAKDICQTVLIKLVEEGRRFPDLGQERAWVVRLSVNACKNWKKSAWFRRRAPLEEGLHLAAEAPDDLLLVESWTTPELQQAHCQTEIFGRLQELKAQYCDSVQIDKFDH